MIVRLLHTTDWTPVYYWNTGIIVEEREKIVKENEIGRTFESERGERKEKEMKEEKENSVRHRFLLQLEGYSIQMFVRGFNPQQFIGTKL